MQSINSVPEQQLQKAVHNLLSDPSLVMKTRSGQRLQILSPGRFNVHEGPDFKEIAMLIEGNIIVGDAEFHRVTSDWHVHNHGKDENFQSVILHVVARDNRLDEEFPFQTLCLDEKQIMDEIQNIEKKTEEVDISSVEDLQDYALLRLLRKSAIAQKLLKNKGLEIAAREISYNFIHRYNSKRRRPVYTSERLDELLKKIDSSAAYNFLEELQAGIQMFIPDKMHNLLREKIHDEGEHLRREIILNCILPIAICLANEEARINLFLWYWSTPALQTYGILKRRFSDMPQNFLWQQQGMLEYIKEHGRKPGMVSEAVSNNYGFAEILSFFRIGRSPMEWNLDD